MTTPVDKPSILIQVTRDGLGHADPELSRLLAGKYFQLLVESDMLPAAICFYTDGVKLVCEGSPVLDPLRALSDKGVYLIVCSTCLEFFGLKDQVRVGLVGVMTDIIEAQWRADKVITL